jgi:NADPH:quinone reductase-like Zn-dependent oxidoreductase
MKAVVRDRYGPPDVLELREVARPVPGDGGVLVRVRAASVNPYDWHLLRGEPSLVRLMTGLRRPKTPGAGADLAGVVEAVGTGVTRFRPGEEVFGHGEGSFAEFAVANEKHIASKPPSLTFEEAAAVPMAGCSALQSLRDKGQVQPGQKVLINGASGGVGTFAVQIARSFGAHVTGVCSARNADMVRSLGASHVVDYAREDFTRSGERYDVILDIADTHSTADYRRALTPTGTLVSLGAAGGPGEQDGTAAIMFGTTKNLVTSRFISQNLRLFIAKPSHADLDALRELIEAGKVKVVIDRRYALTEVPEAIRYVETGHARGKVVIGVD